MAGEPQLAALPLERADPWIARERVTAELEPRVRTECADAGWTDVQLPGLARDGLRDAKDRHVSSARFVPPGA